MLKYKLKLKNEIFKGFYFAHSKVIDNIVFCIIIALLCAWLWW